MRSARIFHKYVSGQFGVEMMLEYVDKLVYFPEFNTPELARDAFCFGLQEIGECWKRFVHAHGSFPHVLFQLCSLNYEDFLQRYWHFQQLAETCPKCVDAEFSHVILTFIPSSAPAADALTRYKVFQLQTFLRDVATFAPISSDLVECLHGHYQSKLHRWRGCKPTDPVAQERMFWTSVVGAFGKLRTWMWNRHGDASANLRLWHFGQKRGNSHTEQASQLGNSSGTGHQFKRMSFADLDNLLAAGKSFAKPRKICGYLPAKGSKGSQVIKIRPFPFPFCV